MCRGHAFAPLCATAFKHKLPTFGAHSHSKAMRFGAPAIVRLKGPLHVTMLLKNVSAEKSKTIEATLLCQGSVRFCGSHQQGFASEGGFKASIIRIFVRV